MEKEWIKIVASHDVNYINILRAMLEQHGIAAMILNQQDSTYPALGEAGLHVDQNDVIRAKHLINEQKA